MSDVSNEDWGRIHARAWKDPVFRDLLESDPTAALKQYGREQTPPKTYNKLVTLRAAPDPKEVPEQFWPAVNPFPPSCC